MRRIYVVLTICFVAVCCCGNLSAQRIDTSKGLGTTVPTVPSEEQDTTSQKKKPPKIRKPLESYYFNDSIRELQNFRWTVDLKYNKVKIGSIDTMLNDFQIDYPYMRRDVGSAYLGNLGGAAVPLNYFTRPEYRNFEFAQAYDVYFYTPDNAGFYNVKRPFTQLSYFSAGQKKYAEEDLHATHAQNISPSTGFNIDYKSRGTRGIYTWQKARDKNLSMAISHTGKKYSAHAGYIYNSVDVHENGGITNDWFITDTIMELPENVPVELHDAANLIKNNTFYLLQSFGVPLRKLSDEDFSIADRTTVYFGMSTHYSRFTKRYTDTEEQSGEYYDNWYVNPVSTYDSICEKLLSNKLFIQMQPWSRDALVATIDGGVGLDMHNYYRFELDQYLGGVGRSRSMQSYYVYGSVGGKLKKYADWGADVTFHPAGYRSGDLDFNGSISLHAYSKGRPISLVGKFQSTLRSPGYWTEEYFSNHYVWSSPLVKEGETRLDLTFSVPHLAMEIGAYHSIATDKIYYDALRLPAQGDVSVSALYASKDFRFGGLHLNNKVLMQWSTDHKVVPVPMASAFMAYYYEFNVVKNVLRLQLGLDAWYNTLYYAVGYNPATAQFYNQREKELGNYLMMDVFAAAKWKRMRILVKWQHANEDLFGSRNYFTVLHYPLNKRVLKMGISWGFYD